MGGFHEEYSPEACEGSEWPRVMEATTYDGRWPASNLFSLEDDVFDPRNWHLQNYWLSANKKAGPDEGFILDLGCTTKAIGVLLKNAQNGFHKDRGTKKFKLLGSTESGTDGPWQTILEKDLEDPRQQRPPPVQKLLFEKEVDVRFLKFEMLEFWGNGGGLQHLSVLTEDDGGDLYLCNQLVVETQNEIGFELVLTDTGVLGILGPGKLRLTVRPQK